MRNYRFKKLMWLICTVGLCICHSKVKLQHHTLDNGFQILLYHNKQAPIIACRLFFTTGSVHEGPGRTGIAHMLEHMLFKGTKKVGITDSTADVGYIEAIDSVIALRRKAKHSGDTTLYKSLSNHYDSILKEHRKLFINEELWETYLKEGGTGLNAFTSDLMTAYFVTLPKNKLELFMWLEADRMQNGILREFYPERDVVMEERRMRYEDSPLGRYWESLTGIFYEAHPYRLPTIGYASDIDNLTREQAEEHYRKYYKPNNAILVLAGDFEQKSTLEMIKKYFKDIPRGEDHAKVVTVEPDQIGEKRLTVYKDDAKPRLDLYFHTPGIPHKDVYALDIIEGVLSGKSGRLHDNLVRKQSLAHSASAGNMVNMYESAFRISVQISEKLDYKKIEKEIWNELKKLAEKPISERELQRVKNQVAARSLRELINLEHLATELAFYQLWGTWEYINIFPEEVAKVNVNQVQEVAKKYFDPNKVTIGLVLPKKEKK